jgi:hypothetical protein
MLNLVGNAQPASWTGLKRIRHMHPPLSLLGAHAGYHGTTQGLSAWIIPKLPGQRFVANRPNKSSWLEAASFKDGGSSPNHFQSGLIKASLHILPKWGRFIFRRFDR